MQKEGFEPSWVAPLVSKTSVYSVPPRSHCNLPTSYLSSLNSEDYIKLALRRGFDPLTAVRQTAVIASSPTEHKIGGGTENRTLIDDLKDRCSTVELHPRNLAPMVGNAPTLSPLTAVRYYLSATWEESG